MDAGTLAEMIANIVQDMEAAELGSRVRALRFVWP